MGQNAIVLVLSCLGIAQALFLSCYLILKKEGDKKASIFLALAILGLTIRIGKSVLNVYLDLEPWQRNLGISGILMSGPFLWFYGTVLLSRDKTLPPKKYLHLIPFLVMVLGCYLIPNDNSTIALVVYIVVFLHFAVYIGLSLNVYLKKKWEVHEQRTIWYRNLLIGFVLIWLFYIGNLAKLFSYYIGGAIFFSLLMYIFSFLFLQKHAFRLGKYNASTLDKSASLKVMQALNSLFEKDETYLESTISLKSIAGMLNVEPRKLSQAINENENKNFSEFVNGHRIEKALKLISDNESGQEKLATIAYDCGFGNVTSFNLAFKTKTGLTPSQYRKNMISDK